MILQLRLIKSLFPLLLFVLFSVSVAAAEKGADVTAVLPNQTAYIIQVFVGLMFVIGLVFAMAWLLKRVGPGSFSGSQQLKILTTLSLGAREKIAIVQVGKQQLLLGITPNSINTLQVFDEPVIKVEELQSNSEFASKLKSIMAKKPVKP